jgi:transcriptional regulator with XRE-family HTH domain
VTQVHKAVWDCRVKAAQLRAGLTQKALAAAAGVDELTVYHAERGYDVRQSTARRIADALGVSVVELWLPGRPRPPRGGCDVSKGGSGYLTLEEFFDSAGFRFKVGDLVCHKTCPSRPWMVYNRLLVQADPGGRVSRMYKVVAISANPLASLDMNLDEWELDEYDEANKYKDD